MMGLRRLISQGIISTKVGAQTAATPTMNENYSTFQRRAPAPVLGPARHGRCQYRMCYPVAPPVQGVGILLPGLAPAAWRRCSRYCSHLAYIAGVTGPLIDADLLNLAEIEQSAVGIASIGTAGRFDSISFRALSWRI
jgi:hypothetical protein